VLTPQQSSFVRGFLAQAKGVDVLVAPTGAGKVATAAEVAAGILDAGAKAILVVADSFVAAHQLATRAASHGAVPLPLTREWAWSHDFNDPAVWPDVVVAFGARSQIIRPPLDEAVHRRDWDLIVVDASWADADARQPSLVESVEWLHNLRQRAVRTLVLLDARFPEGEWGELAPSITHWTRPDLPNCTAAGRLLATEVTFSRTASERELLGAAQAIRHRVRDLGLPIDTKFLDEALDSSLFALHSRASALAQQLRHIRNRLAHGLPPSEEEPAGSPSDQRMADLREIEQVAEACRDLAERAARLVDDSKFEALEKFLETRDASRTAIVSESSATSRYLASRLQASRGIDVLGAPDLTGRDEGEGDVVIVAHDAQLQGLEIAVDLVVYYDLPVDPYRLYFRLSRFTTAGHTPEIVYLVDESTDIPHVARAVEQLRSVLDSPPA
jgi:hypothetical protein